MQQPSEQKAMQRERGRKRSGLTLRFPEIELRKHEEGNFSTHDTLFRLDVARGYSSSTVGADHGTLVKWLGKLENPSGMGL